VDRHERELERIEVVGQDAHLSWSARDERGLEEGAMDRIPERLVEDREVAVVLEGEMATERYGDQQAGPDRDEHVHWRWCRTRAVGEGSQRSPERCFRERPFASDESTQEQQNDQRGDPRAELVHLREKPRGSRSRDESSRDEQQTDDDDERGQGP